MTVTALAGLIKSVERLGVKGSIPRQWELRGRRQRLTSHITEELCRQRGLIRLLVEALSVVGHLGV